ncbi:hypothetical protein, partial [Ferrimonas senticii]|uniref:hypothetical protein n=1 Tax=Ferrimonas senticii TaxID=394566 RepID=UPI0004240E0A
MRQLIQRLPLMMTLLMVLLLGNTTTLLSQDLLQAPQSVLAGHDSRPDLSLDATLSQLASPRGPQSEQKLKPKLPNSWPLVLMTIAMLLALVRLPVLLPRRYLLSPSHRLAGWQESNLQYRFIHSR